MNKGDKVMIKSFLEQPVVRCFWGEHNESVYICREEQYKEWKDGGREPLCTLIRKDLIFRYDPVLFEKMLRFDSLIEACPTELQYLWTGAEKIFINA